MSKINLITCGLLLGIACVVADSTNRRLKLVESDVSQCVNQTKELAEERDIDRGCYLADRNDLQEQLNAVNVRVADLVGRIRTVEANKCCCLPSAPCTCKKDACCPPKHVETKPPPVSKFCRFTMIQIDGVVKTVWFKWLDTDGVEHETRMSLSEFEAWGTSRK